MLRAVWYLLGSPSASVFGSRSTAEEVTTDMGAMTAIITGATSGIGAETARVLAKRGARVVIPARSAKAAEDVRARIVAECPAAAVLVLPPLFPFSPSCFLRHTSLCARCACLFAPSTDRVVRVWCVCQTTVITRMHVYVMCMSVTVRVETMPAISRMGRDKNGTDIF